MLGSQLQTSGDRFAVRGEAPVKAERTLVATIANEGVNQKQVGLAGGYEPSAVGRDIHSKNGITEGRQGRLGVFANLIKEADVTLVASNSDPA